MELYRANICAFDTRDDPDGLRTAEKLRIKNSTCSFMNFVVMRSSTLLSQPWETALIGRSRDPIVYSLVLFEGEGRSLYLGKGILFLQGMIYLLIETYQALNYPRVLLSQLRSNTLSIP